MIRPIRKSAPVFARAAGPLRTGRIDRCLMRRLTDPTMWEKLKAAEILPWIAERQKSGAIRPFCFSCRGNSDGVPKILSELQTLCDACGCDLSLPEL